MVAMRDFKDLPKEKFCDERVSTSTSQEQEHVEKSIEEFYSNFKNLYGLYTAHMIPHLKRWKHIPYLEKSLSYLPQSYEHLDSSRTWLCYWILHSLSLLEVKISETFQDAIVDFLSKCQCEDGGFSGGPGQLAHLAPTYAAVNSLCIIGTKKAYNVINRATLLKFLLDLKSADGAFSMHKGGEVDIRSIYCALAVATLTNVFTKQLFDGTAEWVVSCQTYEGGFAGCPGMEAHGGYTFCGLASLMLLQRDHLCDVQALLRWLVNKQMRYEGGFQGRTNKLVDGCYSFWQGAAFPLIHTILVRDQFSIPENLLFSQDALQEYILICCQTNDGGLLDKPGKPRDLYHTCYVLSGLSIAQHSVDGVVHTVGPLSNKLASTNPLYNIGTNEARNAMTYFSGLQPVQMYPRA